MESLDNIIKTRNWRQQMFSEKEISVPSLINKIEIGYWKSRKIELCLDTIDIRGYDFGVDNLFDFLLHMKLVNKAKLKYPVIVDHAGAIIDGRHRLAKAIMTGKKKLKAIQLLDDIY